MSGRRWDFRGKSTAVGAETSRREYLHRSAGGIAALAVTGVGVGTAPIGGVAASDDEPAVIDDFDRGDLEPYENIDDEDGVPGNYDVTSTGNVYSGEYALEVGTSASGTGIVSEDGLEYYPKRGDRLEWVQWFEGRHSWGRRYGTRWRVVLVGPDGDAYRVLITGREGHAVELHHLTDVDDDEAVLDEQEVDDWGEYEEQWLRTAFDWDSDGEGRLTVTLTDEDGEEVASLEADHDDGPDEAAAVRYRMTSDIDDFGTVYFDEFVANPDPEKGIDDAETDTQTDDSGSDDASEDDTADSTDGGVADDESDADDADGRSDDTSGDDGETDAGEEDDGIPAPGLLAAVTSLFGGGYLLKRRAETDSSESTPR
ncbi:hypothetical protein [Natrarchaeobaculum aegyptiacum]|uniref:hypothetical protein n=1 Tax=Natrarchaeobaculum aegyptiacum TaxID=745377 RepID=UPI00126022BE|nr:hypothetical protein [Natrarchaeobaculum aegyptiacum]